MVKTFTADKDGYIKFTEKELKNLLDEVYREGQKNSKLITWTSPYTYNTWCYSTIDNNLNTYSTINCSNETATNNTTDGQVSITLS